MSSANFIRGILVGVTSELLLAYSPLILAGLVALYFLLPAPIEGRVILLPGPDGKVGSVVVKSEGGEQTLNTAYAGVGVDSSGKLIAETGSADSVKKRYGNLMDAAPPRPVSFTVYFTSGSATQLDFISKAAIGSVKSELAGRPAPEITVIGHTDTMGDLVANDALSLERAATVRDMLQETGIKAVSMEVAGRGEREPIIRTPDDTDEPLNRRVEISVR